MPPEIIYQVTAREHDFFLRKLFKNKDDAEKYKAYLEGRFLESFKLWRDRVPDVRLDEVTLFAEFDL